MRPHPAEGKVAITGMACLFPGSPDLPAFWSNIVRGVNSIRAVSDQEWDAEDYYDPQAAGFGMTYAKCGGFITEFANFDPLKYGIMPSAVAGTDPDQLLSLKVAHDALADAGYANKPFPGDRAEIILGRISAPGAGSMNLIQQAKTVREISSILHDVLPSGNSEYVSAVVSQIQQRLNPCNAEIIPGTMPNVLAGRIAAKLGFRGRSLLVDAACASSLVAVEIAVQDLLAGNCDLSLAGGVHVNSSAVLFQMFCGLGALSRSDTIRPFDELADGTLLGEGIGIICLKRYEDAIADGDRVYAVISGVTSSSDGHGGSVLAPSVKGEALAMQNAYKMAGVSPSTVELLEAHGTGTPIGDVVEMQAVAEVFSQDQPPAGGRPWCAAGTVKSMIGHCQSASAVAGIIKAALALYHRTLPPTLNVSKPNTRIDWKNHPCYINTHSRPWVRSRYSEQPRRAAVSAFGFGGINGHVVMEEPSVDAFVDRDRASLLHFWESELFCLSASSLSELLADIAQLIACVQNNPRVSLKDLAYTLNCPHLPAGGKSYRLAIVASTQQELLQALIFCAGELSGASKSSMIEADKGVYFTAPGAAVGGKLAFLYPGLGSAYANMLSDLAVYFPEVRNVFEIVDNVAMAAGASLPPSRTIFPTGGCDGETSKSLASADFAVVAVLLAEYALYEILRHLDISPDVLMGCSTGEFAAITTGGAVDVLSAAETFYAMSTEVARSIASEHISDLESLRILAPSPLVEKLSAGLNVHLVADFGDSHIIVTGSRAAIESLSGRLASERIPLQPLPVAIPYHTPLVREMVDSDDHAVKSVQVSPLQMPVWSCSTAERYPEEAERIRDYFTQLFCKPVRLRETVRKMYEQGVRKFVEVGPNGVLTILVDDILDGSPHVAVPTNLASRSGLTQLHHLLAVLFTQEVPARFEFLYERRSPVRLEWKSAARESAGSSARLLPLSHTSLKVVPERLPELRVPRGERTGEEEACDLTDTAALGAPASGRLLQPGTPAWSSASAYESSPEAVLRAYLTTSASFFNQMSAVQEQLMKAFLADGSCHEYPFLNRSTIVRDDGITEMQLQVDLTADKYLLDHAIGGFVSNYPQIKVCLMPVMVSLEIMAEAALAHVMSGTLVRIEQVKAFRRISVEAGGMLLRSVATGNSDRVHVEMYDGADPGNAIMQADFVFASSYPSSAQPALCVEGKRPARLTSRSMLYGPSVMFHGPRMQAVLSLERIGERSIAGYVDAGNPIDWMPGEPGSRFLVHPLLLDNASQLVLFYLYENNLPATALLPFYIESIDFYGCPDSLGEQVAVSAALPVLSEKATQADVEIVNVDGSTWARINGIHSRRIVLSDRSAHVVGDPIKDCFGTVVAATGMASGSALVQVSRSALPQDDATLDWCLDYLLTRTEREWWRDASKTDKRRVDWLVGRLAAKEAVRKVAREALGCELGPRDIEIEYRDGRRPLVRFAGCEELPPVSVSISHTDGLGFALAMLPEAGYPGIDAEIVQEREHDFAGSFLSQAELRYVGSCQGTLRILEMTRIWSAKEALFKALGGSVKMSSLEASRIKPAEETLWMSAPDHGSFEIHCIAGDNLVLAYTVAQYTHAAPPLKSG